MNPKVRDYLKSTANYIYNNPTEAAIYGTLGAGVLYGTDRYLYSKYKNFKDTFTPVKKIPKDVVAVDDTPVIEPVKPVVPVIKESFYKNAGVAGNMGRAVGAFFSGIGDDLSRINKSVADYIASHGGIEGIGRQVQETLVNKPLRGTVDVLNKVDQGGVDFVRGAREAGRTSAAAAASSTPSMEGSLHSLGKWAIPTAVVGGVGYGAYSALSGRKDAQQNPNNAQNVYAQNYLNSAQTRDMYNQYYANRYNTAFNNNTVNNQPYYNSYNNYMQNKHAGYYLNKQAGFWNGLASAAAGIAKGGRQLPQFFRGIVDTTKGFNQAGVNPFVGWWNRMGRGINNYFYGNRGINVNQWGLHGALRRGYNWFDRTITGLDQYGQQLGDRLTGSVANYGRNVYNAARAGNVGGTLNAAFVNPVKNTGNYLQNNINNVGKSIRDGWVAGAQPKVAAYIDKSAALPMISLPKFINFGGVKILAKKPVLNRVRTPIENVRGDTNFISGPPNRLGPIGRFKQYIRGKFIKPKVKSVEPTVNNNPVVDNTATTQNKPVVQNTNPVNNTNVSKPNVSTNTNTNNKPVSNGDTKPNSVLNNKVVKWGIPAGLGVASLGAAGLYFLNDRE